MIIKDSLSAKSKDGLSEVRSLAQKIPTKISAEFSHVLELIRARDDEIMIVSGGFVELIMPLARALEIDKVVGNEFVFSATGDFVGLKQSVLTDNHGKAKILAAEKNNFTEIIMIGDGITDAETKTAGVADQFWAYTEHQRREPVVALADREIADMSKLVQVLAEM